MGTRAGDFGAMRDASSRSLGTISTGRSFGGSSTRSSFGGGGSSTRSSFGGPSTSVTFDISRSVAAGVNLDSSESGGRNRKSWPFPNPQPQASDSDGKSIHSSTHSDDCDKVSMGMSINSSMQIGMSVEGSGSSGGSFMTHSYLKAPPFDEYDSMNRGHLNMGKGGTRPRLSRESSRMSRESSGSGSGSAETSGSSGGAVAGPSNRKPPPPLSGGGKVAPAHPTSTVWEGEALGSGRSSGRESEYGGRNNDNSWADIERELYQGNAMPAFSRRSSLDSDSSTTSAGKSRSQPRLPSQVPDKNPVLRRGGNSLSHVGTDEYGRNNKRTPEDNEHESYRGSNDRSTFRDQSRNVHSPMRATNNSAQSTTSTHDTRYLSREGNMGRIARDPSTMSSQHSNHEETRGRTAQYSLTNMRGPMGTSGTNTRRVDSNQLIKEGYSTGLALALSENAARYDFRYWLVDNSGSMQIGDGHRIVWKEGKAKPVACTRWEEITQTVTYHARLASILECPTIFCLLNDPAMLTVPQKFSVCENGASYAQAEVSNATDVMKKVSPSGVTPLTRHIRDIQEHISSMADELRRSGKIVAIILATDGLPTDEQGCEGEDITNDFIRALRSLEGLPIWTVIRLCTDEEVVKRFYNSLDDELELSVEVLDDYAAEAKEVHAHNPWITYALPLHRCRELGYHVRLFDMIDERPLTPSEIRSFCLFVLGLREYDLPDPGADPKGFLKSLSMRLEKEQLQWNPMKKTMTPWVLIKELKKAFSNRNCVIM